MRTLTRILISLSLCVSSYSQAMFFGSNVSSGPPPTNNARHIIGTNLLTGPACSAAFSSTAGSIHFKEQHTWSQTDGLFHIWFECFDGTNFIQVLKSAVNEIDFAWSDGGGSHVVASTSYTLNIGSKNTILVAWSSLTGTSSHIYLNGTDITTTESGSATGTIPSASVGLGNRVSGGGFPCTCDLWDIGFWSTTLTSGNATTLNSCSSHPSAIPTGLLQEWDLTNSTLTSQSGGSALTNSGTTAVVGGCP